MQFLIVLTFEFLIFLGLILSIDDQVVENQKDYVTRTRGNIKSSTSLTLGRGSSSNSFSNIMLELPTFNTVYCNENTAGSLDLVLSKFALIFTHFIECIELFSLV